MSLEDLLWFNNSGSLHGEGGEHQPQGCQTLTGSKLVTDWMERVELPLVLGKGRAAWAAELPPVHLTMALKPPEAVLNLWRTPAFQNILTCKTSWLLKQPLQSLKEQWWVGWVLHLHRKLEKYVLGSLNIVGEYKAFSSNKDNLWQRSAV